MPDTRKRQLILSPSDREEIAKELQVAQVLMGNTFHDLKKLKLEEETTDRDRTNCLRQLRRRIKTSKRISDALKNVQYFVVLK